VLKDIIRIKRKNEKSPPTITVYSTCEFWAGWRKKGLNNIIKQVKKLAKEIDIDGLISKADTIPAIPLQPLIKTVPTEKYKIYPTDNIYIQLLLDTSTGRIWQVQWSTEDETRFKTILNSISLVPDDDGWNDNLPSSRFKLHSTQNTYTFVLLDVTDGRTWQVQWSIDNNRFVTPIY
jgi:hypothetical protein